MMTTNNHEAYYVNGSYLPVTCITGKESSSWRDTPALVRYLTVAGIFCRT